MFGNDEDNPMKNLNDLFHKSIDEILNSLSDEELEEMERDTLERVDHATELLHAMEVVAARQIRAREVDVGDMKLSVFAHHDLSYMMTAAKGLAYIQTQLPRVIHMVTMEIAHRVKQKGEHNG